MLSEHQTKNIRRYYKNLESRFGYRLLLGGSKHMGYYPSGVQNISEREAQVEFNNLLGKKLGLKKGMVVLDAGSGEGVTSRYLASEFSVNIVGLTLVPFEAKRANKKASEAGLDKQLAYRVMDYTKTDYPDSFFDAIYTTETLCHNPDPTLALKEFYRILKPGGTLTMYEYSIAPLSKFNQDELNSLNFVIEGSGMYGLRQMTFHSVKEMMLKAGYLKCLRTRHK